MALKALSTALTYQWQDDDDPDFGTDNATTFVLGALDGVLQARLMDELISYLPTEVLENAASKAKSAGKENEANIILEEIKKYNSVPLNEIARKTCSFAIKDIINFQEEDGVPIVPEMVDSRVGNKTYKVVKPEILDRIQPSTFMKMYVFISNGFRLNEEEEKNSDVR